ncbi:MAG: hypothetical protein IJ877_03955, partial [Candidatus Gastranaerophilales bacterium]|nr:hypothetical protein [Candidatus Gastranaerophilales bacterium]
MRFGGFSEFSHSSIESTNEIQRMQEINQNLLRSLETITVGAKEVEIAELNSAQIRELRRLSAEASCLSQEICDLMLESMSLRLYSGLSEEELSKVKMEEAPKIIIAPDKGTLEEARNEVTRLNACKNGLQTEISEINRLIEAKAVISQKANLRLHNQDVIEQACKRNNEAIQRQLHPSGYSAKESAQFFIEQAHQQEIEQIAKERIEQEKRIEHGIHFQKVLFNETYGRKPKSAQESAEVFIEEQRRIEEEIQRRAKEKETIRLRRLKNDIMINDQLHPSGYSAKESAQFFIEQAHQQEIE